MVVKVDQLLDVFISNSSQKKSFYKENDGFKAFDSDCANGVKDADVQTF